MSFVDEEISIEDSARVHWEQYEEYQQAWSVIPTYWTVDRERDAFIWLIRPATPGWPNQIFGLSWKGDARGRVEVVVAIEETKDVAGPLCDTFVKVLKIKAPDSLKPELDLIRSALQEAFDTYVRRLDGEAVRKVFVSVL
ncbi:hypothetical protein HX890_12565 [Pseudomonas gingeri]|uniref:hypothetical protein n=1 Tax=Pseudomonas gingeri TaxID=117681 RepID=UPI0015A475BB|nr:hypothetical protein [Pseudomonas gingeri]NWD74938.1 hypothetical protein [Pseudomonas gingeri]